MVKRIPLKRTFKYDPSHRDYAKKYRFRVYKSPHSWSFPDKNGNHVCLEIEARPAHVSFMELLEVSLHCKGAHQLHAQEKLCQWLLEEQRRHPVEIVKDVPARRVQAKDGRDGFEMA